MRVGRQQRRAARRRRRRPGRRRHHRSGRRLDPGDRAPGRNRSATCIGRRARARAGGRRRRAMRRVPDPSAPATARSTAISPSPSRRAAARRSRSRRPAASRSTCRTRSARCAHAAAACRLARASSGGTLAPDVPRARRCRRQAAGRIAARRCPDRPARSAKSLEPHASSEAPRLCTARASKQARCPLFRRSLARRVAQTAGHEAAVAASNASSMLGVEVAPRELSLARLCSGRCRAPRWRNRRRSWRRACSAARRRTCSCSRSDLDGHVLSDSLVAYQDGGHVLLPLGELSRLLTLAITVRPAAGHGERLRHSRRARRSRSTSATRWPRVDGRAEELRAAPRDRDRRRHLRLEPAARALAAGRPRGRPRPAAASRSSRASGCRCRSGSSAKTPARACAAAGGERADLGYPLASRAVRHGRRSLHRPDLWRRAAPGHGEHENQLAYTGYFTGDLLGMEGAVYRRHAPHHEVGRQSRRTTAATAWRLRSRRRVESDLRVTLARHDPDAELLGPLHARSFAVGCDPAAERAERHARQPARQRPSGQQPAARSADELRSPDLSRQPAARLGRHALLQRRAGRLPSRRAPTASIRSRTCRSRSGRTSSGSSSMARSARFGSSGRASCSTARCSRRGRCSTSLGRSTAHDARRRSHRAPRSTTA